VLLSDSGQLAASSVKGIADLVSNAVSGMSDQKVTITDQATGALLWPTSAVGGDSSLLAKQNAQSAYDQQEAEQVDAMLVSTLGPGKAVVQVNADYAPKGTVLTSNTSDETLNGAGAGTGGTAGTTNIASYASTGSGNSKYADKSSQQTYGVNKTVSHTVVSPGTINSQSVSVLVAKTVPPSEIPMITKAVSAAAGINAKRGDTLSVSQIAFAKQPTATTASSPTKMLGYAKYALTGLGAMLFLFFMSRMLRKRETEAFAGQPTWLRELESPRSLASLEAERMGELDGPTRVMQLRSPVNVAKQQVEDLVERDPDRVAAQVRQWMTED
jgi:flagellar M-ring protein FliF